MPDVGVEAPAVVIGPPVTVGLSALGPTAALAVEADVTVASDIDLCLVGVLEAALAGPAVGGARGAGLLQQALGGVLAVEAGDGVWFARRSPAGRLQGRGAGRGLLDGAGGGSGEGWRASSASRPTARPSSVSRLTSGRPGGSSAPRRPVWVCLPKGPRIGLPFGHTSSVGRPAASRMRLISALPSAGSTPSGQEPQPWPPSWPPLPGAAVPMQG